MIAKLLSPQGRATRQHFFYCILFAAIGEAFVVLASGEMVSSFAAADLFLIVGCVSAPFAWVQICAAMQRLHDAGWSWAYGLPMIPAFFWPLWMLVRNQVPPIGQLLFNFTGIYTVVFILLLTITKGAARPNTPTAPPNPGTVPINTPQAVPDFDPIVGWLVAIDGPSRGQQYRLRARRNRIGSDSAMEVTIHSPQIERLEHAAVTYDPRDNRYIVTPGSGLVAMRTQSMLQPLMQPAALQPYDRICLGDTTLIFVPLCGPHHQWQLKPVW